MAKRWLIDEPALIIFQLSRTKTILITGSSSGIGKATAKHFQAKGWNVVATMRKPEIETELDKLQNVLVTRLVGMPGKNGLFLEANSRWRSSC